MRLKNILLIFILAIVIFCSGCTDSSNSESTNQASMSATSNDVNDNKEKSIGTTTTVKSIDSIKNSASDVPYKNLYRYNENYAGQIIHYRGEILQAGTDGDYTYWRIATGASEWGGYMDDVIMIVAKDYSGVRLLEEDIVDIWGESSGLYTYTAVMGNEVTIPLISYIHIELVEESVQEPVSFILSEKGTLENPAGIQESVICSYSNKKYEVSVLDVERGNQANNVIAEANMFNDEAPSGYEYALVKVRLHYFEGTESISTSSYDFKAFCQGAECDNTFVVLPENYKEFSSGTLMPGGAKEGWLVFTVPTNNEVLISYQENMFMQGTACYINIGY